MGSSTAVDAGPPSSRINPAHAGRSALAVSADRRLPPRAGGVQPRECAVGHTGVSRRRRRDEKRSEEHTSELQSRGHLVCRLLLEKKKIIMIGPLRIFECRVFQQNNIL